MDIIRQNLIENIIFPQIAMQLLLLLLVLIRPERPYDFSKILQCNHLLLEIQLDILNDEKLLEVIDDKMFPADGIYPLAEGLDEIGDGFESY
jgi:hypothetical protein